MFPVLKRLFALLKGMLSVLLDLPPVTAAQAWWRGLDWRRRRAWHRWWAKGWRPGAWILGLAIAWLALYWIGLWGFVGDLIGLTGDAFRSVQASGFADMDADKQVEALRNLLWGLSVAAGTLGAIVAMGFAAWRTWNDARRTATERRKLETETFAKAIEQLGNDDFAIRLGAILNLETLAKSSPRLHPVIMEAFCAYIREKRPTPAPLLGEAIEVEHDEEPDWKQTIKVARLQEDKILDVLEKIDLFPNDLQAIVTALGRRTVAYDRPGTRLDLRGANLRKADLSGGHFEGANLRGVHLEGASLRSAHLDSAMVSAAHLQGAKLHQARLEEADLEDAHLEAALFLRGHLVDANLRSAHLENAYLSGGNLSGSTLDFARLESSFLHDTNLMGARLKHAHLEGAILTGANFSGADFDRAYLDGAYFQNARLSGAAFDATFLRCADLRGSDISQTQLDFALCDEHTKIPDHLTRPAHWTSAPAADPPDPD